MCGKYIRMMQGVWLWIKRLQQSHVNTNLEKGKASFLKL